MTTTRLQGRLSDCHLTAFLKLSGLKTMTRDISRLTDFFMRFRGNFLPGVGLKVVRVDLKEQRGAVSSSWLRQHDDDAAAG